MMSRDLKWPELTRKWRYLTAKSPWLAGESEKLAYTVHFTSYRAVARRRRHSLHRKWRHVSSGDRSDSEVTSFDRKYPGSGCRRPNWRILYISPTRHLLAGGGSHVTGNDVAWPQVTGSDPEVTWFDRKSPGTGSRRPKTRILYISLPARL